MRDESRRRLRGAAARLPYLAAFAVILAAAGFIGSVLALRVTGRSFANAVAGSTIYAQAHRSETSVAFGGASVPLEAETADRLYGYLTQAVYMPASRARAGEASVTVDFGGGSVLYARDGGTKMVYIEYTALGGKRYRATLQYPVVNAGWKGLMNCLGLPAE